MTHEDNEVVGAWSNASETQFIVEVATPKGPIRSELFLVTYKGDTLQIERVEETPDGLDCATRYEDVVCDLVAQFVRLRQATWPDLAQEPPT